MKYIIQESRLKNVVNDYLDSRFDDADYIDTFIILTDDHDYDDDNGTIIEYDEYDGRLYINKSFLNNVNSMFPVGMEKCLELIKDWFESKYDVVVKYTNI